MDKTTSLPKERDRLALIQAVLTPLRGQLSSTGTISQRPHFDEVGFSGILQRCSGRVQLKGPRTRIGSRSATTTHVDNLHDPDGTVGMTTLAHKDDRDCLLLRRADRQCWI